MTIPFLLLSKKPLPVNLICKNFFHRTTCLNQNGENIRKAMFKKIQNSPNLKRTKVTVIGCGRTGVAVAYNLIMAHYCDEVVLADKKETEKILTADLLDLSYCRSIHEAPDITKDTDFSKTKDSSVIIITAGKSRKAEQSRTDLTKDNIAVIKEIVPPLAKYSPEAIFLVVSNPCDIVTYATLKYSKFPPNRVIGIGCALDSARFRYHISKRLGINHKSVNGYVIGEHGPSAVPCWSSINVAGTALRDIDCLVGEEEDKNNWNALVEKTLNDGSLLLKLQGWSNISASWCMENIVKSILSDAHCVHSVSLFAKGYHGICSDVCLSLPCVLGNGGVESVVAQSLTRNEINQLKCSASKIEESIKKYSI